MNGLELIKHTAGGGVMTATTTDGSVDLVKNGKIEFTDVSQIYIKDCFDVPANPGDEPLYDNYLVVVAGSASSSNSAMWGYLCENGNLETGSNYTRQELEANHTSVTGNRTPASFWRAGAIAHENKSGQHIYFYGPNLKQPTAMRVVNVSGLSGALILDVAGTHGLANPYDGLSFTFSGGNLFTGSLTIYGFTKQNVV